MNLIQSTPPAWAFTLVQHCLKWIMILLLFPASLSQALVVKRPLVEGYFYGPTATSGAKLFQSGEELGKTLCADEYWGVRLDHVNYGPITEPYKPTLYVSCIFKTPNGQEYVQAMIDFGWFFSWRQTCPTYETVYPQGTELNCDPFDKPPQQCPSSESGNPINLATRTKIQRETDYVSAQGLDFSRYYSSNALSNQTGSISPGWRHNYSKKLISSRIQSTTSPISFSSLGYYWWDKVMRSWLPLPMNVLSGDFVSVRRADGYAQSFASSDQGITWRTDSDVNFRLSSQSDTNGKFVQWTLVTPQDETETYDQFGRLASVQFRTGRSQTFSYSDGSTPNNIAPAPDLLIQITDNFGKSIHFQYDNLGRLTSMTDPAGEAFNYAYDSESNLISVTYPDGLKREYLYDEPTFDQVAGNVKYKNLMTGIVDEVAPGNKIRFATYNFDSSGFPISTEHANAVDKFTFDYVNNAVTDPLGTRRSYAYSRINGVTLQTGASQPGGSGCGPSAANNAYDNNGNVTSRYDFNGNRTLLSYDLSRNLETSRTEAFGTTKARTTSTTWHANYRLPLTIAEPNKITAFSYDASGNLLTKSEQATTDANGSLGLAAAPTGNSRSWSYTYNSIGQVLTVTDSAGSVTTTTYDTMGNVATVTNALGQVTTFSNYDPNGRVGTITDLNGLITTLSYSPRGWLTSKTVGDEVTTYAYDGVGQLKTLTQPDGSTINYTYDDAHRLTDIADSQGNALHYTLDAIGNRTGEQVKDPSGTLARQTTRAYDALNRLQQITGGMQ